MAQEPDWLANLDDADRVLVVAAEHPRRIEPQLAISDDGRPRAREVYERKLDGMRLVVHARDGEVALTTRTHEERSGGFPELVETLRAMRRDLVADGEVVAFEGSVTSFSRLQGRIGLNDPIRARLTGIAVHLYLFDLLYLDGYDLRALPLRVRKRLLEREIAFREPVRFTPDHDGDPQVLLAEACSRGWEGLIAKDPDAPYRSGRSPLWRKLKCSRNGEFVIGGWTEPRGSRTGFGALLLGYHERLPGHPEVPSADRCDTVDDEAGELLRYAGKVGTGFGQALLERFSRELAALEIVDSPFSDPPREPGVHWVEPCLVASVAFTEWTRDGRLRHPRFQGLRADKRPQDVVHDGR